MPQKNRSGVLARIRPKNLFKKENLHVPLLMIIAVISFGFNFYAISKTGYGNEYYAAAIRSMTQNIRNFFFVSFDPAGMVSVDKPPLALWIQAIFVLIFGYHGWAMLLPQALAGTGSALMVYLLTAKYFGRPAGLISSLIFAVTPAVVVASRNNTMDMQLVFVLLVAAWFLFKSIEKSKWRYLFIAAVFIGLGFNIKMLQAYMALPAIVLVYLIFAKEKFLKKLLAGLISIAIMAAVSFAWVIAVDLTPASSRPYVDSSTNNTVLELMIGHNGTERLFGQGTGRGMGGGAGMGGQPSNTNGERPSFGDDRRFDRSRSDRDRGFGYGTGTPPQMPEGGQGGYGTPPGGFGGAPGGQNGGQTGGQANGGAFSGSAIGAGMRSGGGMGGNEIGTAGILRLWNSSLYGQASWLIVFCIFSVLAAIRKVNFRKLTLKQGVFAFWVIWLATMYVFFSFAGFYHRYYLCMFSPAVAALSGIGLVEMAKAFREKKGIRQFLLPLSLIATLTVEIIYVWSYSALRSWLVPIMVIAGVAALFLMAAYYFTGKRVTLFATSALTLVSMLAAPIYWATTPVQYVPNTTMPYAGPELASPGGDRMRGGGSGSDTKTSGLEEYLVAHYKAGSYLVVSQNSNSVAKFIIDTGLPAVAYGGFLGSDNSMTVAKLEELVKEGKVTYFLVSGEPGSSSGSELDFYVELNATKIDASAYGGSSSQGGMSGGTLYLFK